MGIGEPVPAQLWMGGGALHNQLMVHVGSRHNQLFPVVCPDDQLVVSGGGYSEAETCSALVTAILQLFHNLTTAVLTIRYLVVYCCSKKAVCWCITFKIAWLPTIPILLYF